MKKDFRSFRSRKEPLNVETAREMFESLDEDVKKEAKSIEGMLKQYENKSQADLMNELTRTVAKERGKGALDNSTLENMAKTMSPMLTDEQRQRLNSLIGQLKD